MNKAYLLIGGNMGDRQGNLELAAELLQSIGQVTARSALYQTAAWGKTDQPAFLNQAIELVTSLPARNLLQAVLKIEEEMGRKRVEKYGPRIIDIDILFFNGDTIDEPGLSIPHPQVQNRRFALQPLQEIAPKLKHPVLKKTITQLLKDCPDKLEVSRYQP